MKTRKEEVEDMWERVMELVKESMRAGDWKVAKKLMVCTKALEAVVELFMEEDDKDDLGFDKPEGVMRNFVWDEEIKGIMVNAPEKYDHPIYLSDWEALIPEMEKLLRGDLLFYTRQLRGHLYDRLGIKRECKHRPKSGQCRHAPELVCDLLKTAGVLKHTGHGRWGCAEVEKFRENAESVLKRLREGKETIKRVG